MSMLKTFLLLAVMTALFMGIGWLVAGQQGALIALAIAAAMNLYAWWGSDKMVLRIHKARPVTAREAPELVEMVEDLARRAQLPVPATYVIDTEQPNAFATGRNPQNAAVAVTRGLIQALSREELAGVIAHELAHIRNRDTLIMTVTATIAGAISFISQFGLFAPRDRGTNPIVLIAMLILAPLAAMVVQMAISRTREYEADRIGAEIVGQPMWLASALSRIHTLARHIRNPQAEGAPATAHMFIVNPLSGERMDNLFSTHPDVQNRIAALKRLSQEMGGQQVSSRPAARSRPARRRQAAAGPWN